MSLTRALVLPLKVVVRAPSLRRSLARFFWATPLILVKRPPANTDSLSGGDGQGLDLVSITGTNAVSIARCRVEGEDVAAGDRRGRGGGGDLGEVATGEHFAADLDDGVNLAVEHMRRP